ncbi:MAG: 50S ribosomal protein L13 [Candidatus Micrarchaeia archaeon]|jgi:large subunit ribosomal protein L13
MERIINVEGAILGRAASKIAKMLLNGDTVVVLNAEKMLISGHEKDIVENYKQRIELKDKANPEHSPYWSRRPDLLVKRVIRGMLPYKKAKGKKAYRLLKVYMGIPEIYKNKKIEEIEKKDIKKMFENTISVKKLAEKLGYRE